MAITYGQGTILKLGSNAVGQRVTISGPTRSVSQIDITNLDSTDKEYAPGLHDGGELSLECQYDPADAQHAAIEALMSSKTVSEWTLQLTDAGDATFTFDGFVTAFELGGFEEDGVVTASITIKVTGPVVFAA